MAGFTGRRRAAHSGLNLALCAEERFSSPNKDMTQRRKEQREAYLSKEGTTNTTNWAAIAGGVFILPTLLILGALDLILLVEGAARAAAVLFCAAAAWAELQASNRRLCVGLWLHRQPGRRVAHWSVRHGFLVWHLLSLGGITGQSHSLMELAADVKVFKQWILAVCC